MNWLIGIYITIAILGIIFGIVSFIHYHNKTKKINKEYYDKIEQKYLKEVEEKYINITNDLYEKEDNLKEKLKYIEKEIKNKEEFNENLYKVREEELNRLIEEKKKEKILLIEREVDDWAQSAQEAATQYFNDWNSNLNKQINELETDYAQLKEEVNNFQEKRNVINQEILRSRAIEENQSFYSIQLDEESKRDIEIFQEIKSRISKIEKLNKLIYDNYINKPASEMIKRILEGRNPSGIYKVTNLKTKEIYIGKSTSIADRWKNHIKAACGLAGAADSQFQRALRQYGIENFSWEVLEEVPKDKLTEREKYYINFYDTLHYGYNQRLG